MASTVPPAPSHNTICPVAFAAGYRRRMPPTVEAASSTDTRLPRRVTSSRHAEFSAKRTCRHKGEATTAERIGARRSRNRVHRQKRQKCERSHIFRRLFVQLHY